MALLEPLERRRDPLRQVPAVTDSGTSLSRGRLRRLLLPLLLPLLLLQPLRAPWAVNVPDSANKEYAVKSAILLRLALFVSWPQDSKLRDDEPFILGILGDDPFGSILTEVVAGEEIAGHPIKVVRSSTLESILASRILFISRSEADRLPAILKQCAANKGILTVGESPRFCERGGMVNLQLRRGNVQLDLNRDEVEGAGLRVSSKLVQVARIVASDASPRSRERPRSDEGGQRGAP